MTNMEWLKSLTSDELADALGNFKIPTCPDSFACEYSDCTCPNCYKIWLEKEHKE